MQRHQNREVKKNIRLKWIIVLLTLIILIFVGVFLLNIFGSDSPNQKGAANISSENSSLSISNSSTKNSNSLSSDINENADSKSSYGVNFNGNLNYNGNYGTLKFDLTNGKSEGGIELTYDSPNFEQTQSAMLVPVIIPTKLLKVNENSSVREVKVNTELKLDNVTNAATKDFFYPFNGNDTKIYAYYMNNGHIALAFQPGSNLDQYQVIEFTGSSNSISNNAPSFEEAQKIMQDKDQNNDIVYADLGTSSDEKGYFRKIKATSISMRNNGGSGTLGFMKVYSDGTTVETSNGDFESLN